MGLSSLRQVQAEPDDGRPDDPSDDAPEETSSPAATTGIPRPVAASPSVPSRPPMLRQVRSPVAVPVQAPAPSASKGFDDDLGGLDGAPKAEPSEAVPAARTPARAAAPADLATLLESRLATPGIPSASASADVADEGPAARAPGGINGDRPDTAGSVDPAAEEADAQGLAEAPEVTADPDSLVYDLTNAPEIVRHLLLSGDLPPAEAQEIARDYMALAARKVAPRQEKLTRRQKELDEELQRVREAEAANQATGRGGLGSLLGSMLSRGRGGPGKVASLRSKVDREERAVRAAETQVAESFLDRMFETKKRQYQASMLRIHGDAAALKRAVVDYNEAFVEAETSRGLKQKLVDYARAEGISLDEALSRADSGRAPKEVTDEFASVRRQTLLDPDVLLAKSTMEAAESRFSDGLRDTVREVDSMSRFFDDGEERSFKVRKAQEELMNAFDLIEKDLPDPVAEEEGRRKMRERMREIAESVRQAIENIMQKITAAFTRATP